MEEKTEQAKKTRKPRSMGRIVVGFAKYAKQAQPDVEEVAEGEEAEADAPPPPELIGVQFVSTETELKTTAQAEKWIRDNGKLGKRYMVCRLVKTLVKSRVTKTSVASVAL